MNPLLSISPLDGRYHKKVEDLQKLFSEKALIERRIYVENSYLKFIIPLIRPDLSPVKILKQKDGFAERVKDIEKDTNHDVKAVEYYLQELYAEEHPEYIPYIHIGLTSADINSLSRSLILKDITKRVVDEILQLTSEIENIFRKFDPIPMLARTHGQPATPTTLYREGKVYTERLVRQVIVLKNIEHRTKFGGATGNFNALKFAYPDIDWDLQLNKFIESMDLKRHNNTTQIDHFDNYSEVFDCVKRINIILIDLCQDIWLYTSMDYFKLNIIAGEVGSSTMPHKVNPIDFENAEGNLKLSNVLFSFMSEKLPVSRLQRDLTDSTVARNIGVAYGHAFIAYKSVSKGLTKLEPNKQKIKEDLEDNYVILGEAVQTILRKYEHNNAYEIVKNYTRNNTKMTQTDYIEMVSNLDIPNDDKLRLSKLEPSTYL